jgi:uncharacterized protein (DUF362 family)/ferredoxin
VVFEAVKRGIDLLGGPGAFAKPGEAILLKPNLLAPDSPEKATITHPMVFRAVAEVLQSTRARIAYGDSPGGLYDPSFVAKKTGFTAVAEELGLSPADFTGGQEVLFERGIQNKRFTIANGVMKSDGVISLPKLKTHGFQRFTGCIKNQFGCIPGPGKAEFHVKTQDPFDFARMLVDLTVLIKPRLYVMDAVTALEGNGPRGGNPKKLKVLLLSTDPIALDATACRMIQCDPRLVPTIVAGEMAGAGTAQSAGIEIVGDSLENFIDRGFDIRRGPIERKSPGRLFQFIKKAVVPQPHIILKKCVKCGACISSCPVNPKAIGWRDENGKKKPGYNHPACIRCFCCQEFCPEGAIRIKTPLLRNAIFTALHFAAGITAIKSSARPNKKKDSSACIRR